MVDRDNATILEDYYYLGSAFVYRFNGRFNEELDWVVIWFNPATKIGEPRQELKVRYHHLTLTGLRLFFMLIFNF